MLQNFSQVNDNYGSSKTTTILSNADVMEAFRTNHLYTFTKLSRKGRERNLDNGNFISCKPLITQSQLRAMETGQALVMSLGRRNFIIWLSDYRDILDFNRWTLPKKRFPRKNSPVPIFDISEYTKRLCQNKIEAILGTNFRHSNLPTFFDQLSEPSEATYWRRFKVY